MTDECWDIMSGTAVESMPTKQIVIAGKGMNKIEFDALLNSYQKNLNMQDWVKEFSGFTGGEFKAIFTKKDVI